MLNQWKFLVLTLVVLLVSATIVGLAPRRLYVPGDYPTIQAAINAASPGDTVQVAAGTYYENITLKDGVNVLGAGADTTIIDGQRLGPVVRAYNVSEGTTLSGFTITNGYAYLSSSSSPGGTYSYQSSPTTANCPLADNMASPCCALRNGESWSTIALSGSSGNTVGRGGGIYIECSSPTISNCTISGNGAEYRGGGICTYKSSPTIINCTIAGNTCQVCGGGIGDDYYSSSTIANCTIVDNVAGWGAGGVFIYRYSSSTIINCTISGNTGPRGGAFNIYDHSSPTIDHCTISGNTAAQNGGGLQIHGSSSLTITNCTVSGNTAVEGGGILIVAWAAITNCIISGNQSRYHGGGIWVSKSSPIITNCTISGNTALRSGGIYNYTGAPIITNCIIWGNSVNDLIGYGATYSNIGSGQTAGEGNISADPQFVDPAGGDYHLTATSPCIDAGNNLAPAIPLQDFEGNLRVSDGNSDGIAIVDMGADEAVFGPDTTPPLTSSVYAYNITLNSASIAWQTNEPATSMVEYGTTTDYNLWVSDPTLVYIHKMTLTGLAPSTTYHYRVRSADRFGNEAYSGDYTFTTLIEDNTPPTAPSQAYWSPSGQSSTTTISANWTAAIDVETGVADYYLQVKEDSSDLSTGPYLWEGWIGSTKLYETFTAAEGIRDGHFYCFHVRARDNAGNIGAWSPTSASVKVGVGYGSIYGTVQNSLGAAIAGATVQALEHGTTKTVKTTYTGADGSYILSNLAGGLYDVKTFAQGYVSDTKDNNGSGYQVDMNLAVGPVDFALGGYGSIVGRVTAAATDEGIAYATVSALVHGTTTSKASTYTSADGYYVLTNLPVGLYDVRAIAQGYVTQIKDNNGAGYQVADNSVVGPIDFALAGYGAITGWVTDAATDQGIAFASVRALVHNTTTISTYAYTRADGHYIITNLPGGLYDVQVYKSGYKIVTDTNNGAGYLVSELQITGPVNIALTGSAAAPTTGSISGKITKSDGITPISGAIVRGLGPTLIGVYTAPNGSYALCVLNPGTYTVEASAPGYITKQSGNVSVTAGTDTEVNLSLDGYGSISGKITKADGSTPIWGAKVRSIGTTARTVYTVADGSYVLYGLNPGTYTVEASAPGYVTKKSGSVTVTAGTDTKVNLSLTAYGSIYGSVVRKSDGTPINLATVVATNIATSKSKSTSTGADGRYVIDGLEPGNYNVKATATGYTSQTKGPYTVGDGQSVGPVDFGL